MQMVDALMASVSNFLTNRPSCHSLPLPFLPHYPYLPSMKYLVFSLFLLGTHLVGAQNDNAAAQFWTELQKHCGKAYEGQLLEAAGSDAFTGKKLLMHVRACEGNTIRIPFYVGDDRSRTWVLTFDGQRITLRHDHRHEDGSEDSVTQYGGTATNSGLPTIQVFPADVQTTATIPAAATNVWWITLDGSIFSYNLRRLGTDRLFTVKFDLTQPTEAPPAPWGWKE